MSYDDKLITPEKRENKDNAEKKKKKRNEQIDKN